MENNSNNCVKKLRDNMWVLIALLIKVAFSIASFVCRNDSKKIAVIGFIETLLAVLLAVLTIIFKDDSCCKKRDEKNENEKNEKNDENDESEEMKIIKKGQEFLESLILYSIELKGLKKIAEKNDEARRLLDDISNGVKDFISN